MRRPKPPMPRTLRIAWLVLAALVIYIVATGENWYFAVVPVLTMAGLVWAHPVVRTWTPGLMVWTLFFYAMAGSLIGIILAMVALVLLMAGMAAPADLAYFDLICPHCGSHRVRLWIRRIRCMDCDKRWLPREGGVDVDAFD